MQLDHLRRRWRQIVYPLGAIFVLELSTASARGSEAQEDCPTFTTSACGVLASAGPGQANQAGPCENEAACGSCPVASVQYVVQAEKLANDVYPCLAVPAFSGDPATLRRVGLDLRVEFIQPRIRLLNLDPNSGCDPQGISWQLSCGVSVGMPTCAGEVDCGDVLACNDNSEVICEGTFQEAVGPFPQDGRFQFCNPIDCSECSSIGPSACVANEYCVCGPSFVGVCEPCRSGEGGGECSSFSETVCLSAGLEPFSGDPGRTVVFPVSCRPGILYAPGPPPCAKYLAGPVITVRTTLTVTYSYCDNAPPVAGPDEEVTCRDACVLVDVLDNDSDDHDDLDCGSVQILPPDPAQGSVELASCTVPSDPCSPGAPGSNCPCVLFRPARGFTGLCTFQYTVADGDGCRSDPATVQVLVREPPTLTPDSYEMCRDGVLCTDVLANDLSAPDCALDCMSLRISSPPSHGTATVCSGGDCLACGPCSGCHVCYVPSAGFSGSDAFEYEVSDCHGCSSRAPVELVVFPPPQAVDDFEKTCADEAVVIDVLCNDVALASPFACGSLELCSPPTHGTISFAACDDCVPSTSCASPCSCPLACLLYRPDPGFAGVETFTYRIADQRGCVSGCATVVVRVKPRPDAVDDLVRQETPIREPIEIDVLANDSPGTGCELVGCAGGACAFDGCPVFPPPTVGPGCLPTQGRVSAGPNCTLIYTPDPDFSGTDTFCYAISNSCGCSDLATVVVTEDLCLESNRRRPASLLLYPHFDNRQQALTLVSLTNTDCNPAAQPVDVEFVFLDGSTCLESNRTFRLSACDTLTFLTSDVNPNQQQGYLYAFAKNLVATPSNPAGTPIAFNYLIGNELLLDGIEAFDFSINAVGFRGQGREREANDDDEDGIRDLNGPFSPLPEYDGAPDQILIPRYLGQDNGGAGSLYASRILLVALSGGRSFETSLDILGFNDSEEQFSATYSFRCWSEPLLRDFAPFTLEAFLDGLGSNDPLEILGAENREAGWIRIDGASADSSAEHIADPAFYAVLVEHAGTLSASDLPWESCSQDNGDLLPSGPLGDGPVPVAGDDQ